MTDTPPDTRYRAPRSVWWLVAVVILLSGLLAAFALLPRLPNPFAEREVDRSQPVLLEQIRDLSRYQAASGNFQVVIDLEQDAPFLPSALLGERTLFVAAGTVDAYVEFAAIANGAIQVSADRKTASVRLPHAELEPVNLDHKRSHIFASQRGVLNRLADLLADNPGDQQRLYVLAERKIFAAAKRSDLQRQAEQNTRSMLVGMLGSLGYTKVTVRFDGTSA